jgi:hypothetical protein
MTVLKNPKHELSELKAVLRLCEETWRFIWLKDIGRARCGQIAGTIQNNGYRIIRLDRQPYLEHHLVWFFKHGVWPRLLDHKDGDRVNNDPVNLRLADNSGNAANSKRFSTNSSGFKGVSRTAESHAAYVAAAVKYQGEFARAA